MMFHVTGTRRLNGMVCILLAMTITMGPSITAIAQTNAAAMAVRRSVDNIGGAPSDPNADPASPEYQPAQGGATPSTTSSGGTIDTRYISPGAMAVIVLRPAQLMTSPIVELLPTEVVSAAGLQYGGINPADVDEIIGFVDMPNPAAVSYGLTFKFNKPFRGASIPPHARPAAQLSELNGKKYLQSAAPMFPSFYGPNSQMLVAAPDDMLRKLVESPPQAASGTLLDRVQVAPAGSDLYVAVNVAMIRPMLQMQMAMAPPETAAQSKQLLEVLNLVSAAELTLDATTTNPISLVIHANDEAAAQQLEAMLLQAKSAYLAASQGEQPAPMDPVGQAMAQYKERIQQRFQPQRNGASITCFYLDGQNQAQKQFLSGALLGAAIAVAVPKLHEMQNSMGWQQAGPGQPPNAGSDSSAGQFPVDPSAPQSPGPESVDPERR